MFIVDMEISPDHFVPVESAIWPTKRIAESRIEAHKTRCRKAGVLSFRIREGPCAELRSNRGTVVHRVEL